MELVIAVAWSIGMWFLNRADCESWCNGTNFSAKDSHEPVHGESESIVVPLLNLLFESSTGFSNFVASTMQPFDECLLWVTQWGVWLSSENLHLLYRLRESYGERRHIQDAPGHLFSKHETPDLATYVQVALLFGWDFHILPDLAYASAFSSHDGFIHLYSGNANEMDYIEKHLIERKLEYRREFRVEPHRE